MDDSIKILVIDDHPSYLEGVSLLLRLIMPNSTILTAKDGSNARALLRLHVDIDWILLDLNLPDCSGVELVRYLNDNKTLAHIVVISGEDDPGTIDEILNYGVSGFLTKDFDSQVLTQCINTIENDGVYLAPKHKQMLNNYRSGWLKEKQLIEEVITSRQLQTLLLIAKGYSNHEIADQLGITESTIKKHVSLLIAIFESDNRTHCVAEARRLKFVD